MTWIIIEVMLLFVVHLALELRQQSLLIEWTDERDKEFAQMFQAAWNLTLIPKDNPLNAFKEHGMLSRNAVNIEVVSALDVRLEAMAGATNAVGRTAKALRLWEQTHPAPPLHYWQAWWQAIRNRRKDGRLSERPPTDQTMPDKPFPRLPSPVKEIES